jgi:hypothetical protein
VPTKAAYVRFEQDPTTEFEFFLAQKLGMTVARLRAEMTNQEFMEWGVFYARKAQREELEIAKGR